MSPSLWEDVKKTFKEGVSIAAEKTEEYTKIGKVKVEILNIKRNIDKSFTDLGRGVYTHIAGGRKTDVAEAEKVKKLVAEIKDLKASLKAKEAEIEAIKKEASSKKEKESRPPAARKPKATGAKKGTAKRVKK